MPVPVRRRLAERIFTSVPPASLWICSTYTSIPGRSTLTRPPCVSTTSSFVDRRRKNSISVRRMLLLPHQLLARTAQRAICSGVVSSRRSFSRPNIIAVALPPAAAVTVVLAAAHSWYFTDTSVEAPKNYAIPIKSLSYFAILRIGKNSEATSRSGLPPSRLCHLTHFIHSIKFALFVYFSVRQTNA